MTDIQAPQRDPNFYFSFRTFQVEDTLFRVPRHLFLMPKANIQPIPHGTDNNDDFVALGQDILKDDFLQLVRAVYPRQFNTPEKLSPEAWLAVFKLSENFGLDDVRKKAASNLRDHFFAGDPVDALICARDNNIAEWKGPLIDKIVEESRELTDEELDTLGLALAMRIARAQGAAEAMGEPGLSSPKKGSKLKKKGKK